MLFQWLDFEHIQEGVEWMTERKKHETWNKVCVCVCSITTSVVAAGGADLKRMLTGFVWLLCVRASEAARASEGKRRVVRAMQQRV